MAKLSWIEKEKRKRVIVAKYAALRAELKAKGDYVGLAQLPRASSPVRLVNRCLPGDDPRRDQVFLVIDRSFLNLCGSPCFRGGPFFFPPT